MNNLIHLSETRQTVSLQSSPSSPTPSSSSSSSSYTCITSIIHERSSPTSSTTYLLTNNGHVISTSNTSSSSSSIVSWITPLSTIHSDPSHYFSLSYIYPDDEEKITVISHGGSILTIDPHTGDSSMVGRFENGIITARWSPDGEILILMVPSATSKGMTMLSMTSSFETLTEIEIPDGRAAPSAPHLSFRPDGGRHFALLYGCVVTKRRRLSIFESSTLETTGVGRNEDGSGRLVSHLSVEKCLAWGGNAVNFLIGGVQQTQKKATIVFFEPNGLRHGEFNCLAKDDDDVGGVVENLCWNVDGTLLAVTIKFSKQESSSSSSWCVVRLYHRRNYHWYGKYEHSYDKGILPSFVTFDTEHPLVLRVGLSSSETSAVEWRTYEYCWDVSIHPTLVTAGVIDGSLFHLTPFERAMVPPPMSAASLELCDGGKKKRFIRCVSPCPSLEDGCWRCEWVVLLSDGGLVLIGHDGNTTSESSGFITNYDPPRVLTRVDLSAEGVVDDTSDTLRQITVIDQTITSNDGGGGGVLLTIGAISCRISDRNEHLVTITLTVKQRPVSNDRYPSPSSISIIHHTPLTAPIYRLTPTLLHLTDQSLISHSSDTFTPHPQSPLLELSPILTSLPNNPSTIISLSSSHHLYANDRMLHPSVSSVSLTSSHLLYATEGNKPELTIIPLSSLDDDVMTDVTDAVGFSRPLERGSVVACVVDDVDPRVVLQLPRGNLEGVYPKALTIPKVLDLVARKKYGAALGLCRRRKVDLNLLVDGSDAFFEDVGVFVEEVKSVDYLNLFITCLVEGNVLSGTPWEVYKKKEGVASSAKIDTICNALLSYFTSTPTSTTQYLLPILTTYAKRTPPNLAGALTHLKSQSSTHQTTGLNYLFLLCAANQSQIYEAALSLYDYDLARDVCRKSRDMDPKVYIPQLKRWGGELEEDMARYEVDVVLKRWNLALRSAKRAGLKGVWVGERGWTEVCMDLIEREGLHKEGMALFRDENGGDATTDCNKIMRERIVMSLGDKLSKEGRYEEAMVTYLTEVNDSQNQKLTAKARHAAKKALDWQTFLSLSSSSDCSADARDFVDQLSHNATHISQRERCLQSARLLLDYCRDVDGAIDKLCEGEEWNEAMRVAAAATTTTTTTTTTTMMVVANGSDDEDFVLKRKEREDRIRDTAISSARIIIDDLAQRKEAFKSTMERYETVVDLRRTAAALADDTGMDDHDDAGSLYSTSSTYSQTSQASASSMGSSTSSSSIGGSVMSVSSARSNAFSLTGDLDVNKHKSKYNTVGQRGKKKKKKKKQGRPNRIKMGSEEELKSLVYTLTSSVVDEGYRKSIDDTLLFLLKRCQGGGRWDGCYLRVMRV